MSAAEEAGDRARKRLQLSVVPFSFRRTMHSCWFYSKLTFPLFSGDEELRRGPIFDLSWCCNLLMDLFELLGL